MTKEKPVSIRKPDVGGATDTKFDFDKIIEGLDYDSFVLLPGTKNPRPGMKYADETVVPSPCVEEEDEEVAYYEEQFVDHAPAFETPIFPAIYFYPPPPPYWGGPFLLAAPRYNKKSKKKNKKKRNKNKQRQRLEKESQVAISSPPSSPLSEPIPSDSASLDSSKSESRDEKNLGKKKRSKHRRRGGRSRRASAPPYFIHGMDAMAYQFAGLGINDVMHVPVLTSGVSFPKCQPHQYVTGIPHPYPSPQMQRPLWNHLPLYEQVY